MPSRPRRGKRKKKGEYPLDEPLRGRRLIRLLDEQLDELRQHPAHGNRVVHLDHLVVAHLLVFFNPAMAGLRTIEDVFDVPRIRQRFGTPRLPKSTLSDAHRVFDPDLLLPLIDDLQRRANLQPHDARLDAIARDLIAVDGTFFAVAPRIAWALYNKSHAQQGIRKGNVRADVHYDILRGVPTQAALCDGRLPEGEQLRQHVESGKCYVLDRGFQPYELLRAILEADSDFLVRQRSGVPFERVEERPLHATDRLAGVLADTLVHIPGLRAQRALGERVLRVIEIAQPDGEPPMQLLTNRLDLSAEVLGLLYRHRWQIELFFRWLKCMANFRHFYSESPDGMTLQVYVAIIATLLLSLIHEAKPNKYDIAMMRMVVSGLVPWEDAQRVLAKRRATCARDAERARARRAKKQSP